MTIKTEIENQIIELRVGGASIKSIAAELHVSAPTVSMIIKKRGLLSRQCVSLENRNAIIEMHARGTSIRELAEIFGRAEHTIRSILNGTSVLMSERSRQVVVGTPLEDEVVRRYQAGESSVSIVRDMGISKSTLQKIINLHGIKREYEAAPKPLDFDRLAPREVFPPNDTFDLHEEERKRLEEIRAAKIRNYQKLEEGREQDEIDDWDEELD